MLIDPGTSGCEPRTKRVAQGDSSCRRLIVPLFRGSSRFESLILPRHSRFECECNQEYMTDRPGSYVRLIDSRITQLKAQGPSRTCNKSKEEEEEDRRCWLLGPPQVLSLDL